MNKKELLDRIYELFEERLQRKTGWGRNEILEEYKQAKLQALMEALDNA